MLGARAARGEVDLSIDGAALPDQAAFGEPAKQAGSRLPRRVRVVEFDGNSQDLDGIAPVGLRSRLGLGLGTIVGFEAGDVQDGARGFVRPARSNAHACLDVGLVRGVDDVQERCFRSVEEDQGVGERAVQGLVGSRRVHPGPTGDRAFVRHFDHLVDGFTAFRVIFLGRYQDSAIGSPDAQDASLPQAVEECAKHRPERPLVGIGEMVRRREGGGRFGHGIPRRGGLKAQ